MLISHEIPKQLFPYAGLFNDYPYVLGHLLKLDPEYKEYYKGELAKAKFSILDNSAFELGASIDAVELNQAITELRPTHYILPDVLHDKEATLVGSKEFYSRFGNTLQAKGSLPIAVVQGNCFEDLRYCIKQYHSWGIGYIAIPFDCIKESDWSTIRFQFFNWLEKYYQLPTGMKIHFLGIQNPQEMLLYSQEQLKKITSFDSSSPIIHGWVGNEFGDYGTSAIKPKAKLADNLDIKLGAHQIKSIVHNIKKFRSYVER